MKNGFVYAINLIIGSALLWRRFNGETDQLFQAVAHSYAVPLLVVGWFRLCHIDRWYYDFDRGLVSDHMPPDKFFWCWAWVVAAGEVAAFILFKYGILTR